MSRLSREKKRDQNHAAHPAALVAAPIDVYVPATGPGAGGASIGGVPVVPAAGEEIQQAVLNHLHRIALATGHPVQATVRDERIGCVVRLRVEADGSSSFTGEPVPMEQAPERQDPARGERSEGSPCRDEPTHVLRSTAEPVREAAPASPLRAVSEPQPLGERVPASPARAVQEPSDGSTRTFAPRSLPEPVEDRVPGTVVPPTGEFGPPPPMDAVPRPSVTGADRAAGPESAPQAGPGAGRAAPSDAVPGHGRPHAAAPAPRLAPPTALPSAPGAEPPAGFPPAPAPPTAPARPSAPAPRSASALLPASGLLDPSLDPEPKSTPTPARGFDAVAEAVLGDEPVAGSGALAEPMTRINEAVKTGRIEEAAGLAEQAVGEATGTLGPDHPEVLKLRELTAYIAYLAGDPVRSLRLSLDLARIRRRARDAEAAYGNIQSAASAWRAVRDPHQGLELGRELIGLWTELATEDGPAAEDIEQLESARARMGRLTERARTSAR